MEKLKRETVVRPEGIDCFLLVLSITCFVLSTAQWPKHQAAGFWLFTFVGLLGLACGPGQWVYGNLRGKAVTLSDGTHAFRGWWPRLDKRFPRTKSG